MDNIDVEELLEEATIQGVVPLIFHSFSLSKNCMGVQNFESLIKGRYLASIISSKLIHKEGLELLNELNNQKIKYVVLKGFALAYQVYPTVDCRPSVDIDIMFDVNDLERAKAIYVDKGYCNKKAWEPEAVHFQFTFSKPLVQNVTCHWDVHKAISNDIEVSQMLPFDEIYAHHIVVSEGDSQFKSISKPYAFIHASIHFLRHKYRKDLVRLIWLYDLYALSKEMTKTEQEQLITFIERKGISKVIVEAINDTMVYFQHKQLLDIKTQLLNLLPGSNLDYLLNNRNGFQRFAKQLHSAKGVGQTLLLLKETLFPPKEQIYLKYGKVKTGLLWFYYARRIVSGAFKWARN